MSIYKALFFTFFSTILLYACGEEEEAPVQFDTVENTAPETTKVRYYCPSVYGGEKEYFVSTDFSECLLKLRCSNCRNIDIACELRKPYVPETGGNTTTAATSEETGIYVSLSDAGVITIRFTALNPDYSPYGYFGTIKATDRTDRKRTTTINLARRNPNLDRPE